MEGSHQYEIRLESYLTDLWSDWFDGLSFDHEMDGETSLKAALPDQAALLALLAKINALNVSILAVVRVFPEK